MNDKLHSRLLNFKFKSAMKHLDNEPDKVKELVEALCYSFSDVGWFNGNVAVIVMAALQSIGVHFDGD